jgi:hypothetical protein
MMREQADAMHLGMGRVSALVDWWDNRHYWAAEPQDLEAAAKDLVARLESAVASMRKAMEGKT